MYDASLNLFVALPIEKAADQAFESAERFKTTLGFKVNNHQDILEAIFDLQQKLTTLETEVLIDMGAIGREDLE